jgi:hypothetical protein
MDHLLLRAFSGLKFSVPAADVEAGQRTSSRTAS